MSSKSLGNTFQEEIARGLEALKGASGFYQRLRDVGSPERHFKHAENPCDFLFYHYPYLFGIECKATRQKRLDFSAIRDCQWEGLKWIEQAGGIGLFAINFRNLEGYRTGRAFLLSYKKAQEFRETSGRKSFPFDWVAQNAVEIYRTKFGDKYGWDLGALGVE